jgi:peptide/nickel transport system substrate-binding protein
VRFIFKEPYYMAFEAVGGTQVMSKKFYSKYTAEQFNESTGLLLGSGPYRLQDPTNWRPEPGKPIVLVRNERYWGEPGGPNRLVWRIIDLPAARMTALRNGEIDVYYMPNPDQFDAIKADPALSARVNLFSINTLNGGYYFIGWNEKRAGKPTPFADVRVRRAMTMLIDRDAIVREVMRGYASTCSGPFNLLSPQSDPSIKPLPFDPEQAKSLLAQAGFKQQNNTLVGPDGKQFEFDFMYGSTSQIGKRVATFVQDGMARAGIVVHPVAAEWSVMLQRQKERDFDALFMGWGGGAVEDDPQQIFHSGAISGVGDNFVQFSNPQVDAAIDKARTTMDENARMKLWHEVHRLLHEGQPYTFMFADLELDAVDKRFKGVEPTKFGLMLTKNEWYVPKPMQKYHN